MAAGLWACSGFAHAQATRIVPSLGATVTLTDNVLLAPKGFEQSDAIFTVEPGVSIQRTSARTQLAVDYRLVGIAYARESDFNDIRHNLNGAGRFTVVPERVFITAGANVGQQFLTVFGPRVEDPTAATRNIGTTYGVFVRPQARGPLFGELTYDLRYSLNFSGSDTALVDDTITQGASFRVGPDAAAKLSWALFGEWYRGSYDNAVQADENIKYGLSLGYAVLDNLRVLANAGWESDSVAYTTFNGEGFGWNAGLAWRPSAYLQLTYLYGHRYFGTTQDVDVIWNPTVRTSLAYSHKDLYYGSNDNFRFSHRTRHTAFRVGYTRALDTIRNQVLVPASGDLAGLVDANLTSRFPNPEERKTQVDQFLRETGLPTSLVAPTYILTNRPQINSTLDGSFAVIGARNTITLSMNATETEIFESAVPELDDFTRASKIRGVDTALSWNHRLSTRTSAQATARYTFSKGVDEPIKATNSYYSAGIYHTFTRKVTGLLLYRFSRQRGEGGAATFDENALVGALRMTF